MKGRSVDELVYEFMFPRPKPADPQTFSALLQRSLIPEVRQETQAFYGHLDTQEAKYPGLDYTHPTHRIRLSRWHWHSRLFRAFNALGLTHAEIAALTKWEGTKWAKDKFEKEQGVVIRDTTADGFPDCTESTEQPCEPEPETENTAAVDLFDANDGRQEDVEEEEVEEEVEQEEVEEEGEGGDEDDQNQDESDEELQSIGLELNQRLRSQAARREAGETSAVLDEEWEQWLKYAIETGELTIITEQMTEQLLRRPPSSSSVIPTSLIPPNMLTAARAGNWAEIPEFLHSVLRRTLEADDSATSASRPASSSDSSSLRQWMWPRRTYSDLRLPLGDASRTAEARGA